LTLGGCRAKFPALPAIRLKPKDDVRRRFLCLVALVAVGLPACGDSFGPGFIPLPSEPTQDTLFDFRTSELRDPSAFNILTFRPARPDQTDGWDFLFQVAEGGGAELVPRAVIFGEFSTAGFQKTDRAFESITEAPENGYESEAPTPIAEGDVLFAVSRQSPTLGISCRQFMKLEILSLDLEGGEVVFRHLGNPNCGRRGLVPGLDG